MFGATLKDSIAEVVQAAGGAKGLVFAEILNREVGELGRCILNKVAEDGFLVVADQVDLVDRGDLIPRIENHNDNCVSTEDNYFSIATKPNSQASEVVYAVTTTGRGYIVSF
jgi:hypothetical protein